MFQKKKDSSKNEEEKDVFAEVLGDELKLLYELRDESISQTGHAVYRCAYESNLAGLAFSGGGIRSATFNLGVIQALSRYGLLSKFDYLSTVSGGGFIGGWLSALLHRQAVQNGKVDEMAVRDFQENLAPHPKESKLNETVGFKAVEHKAVRYLRGYSNYLSPKIGLSGDALAAAAIFFRNFVLIQLTLISLVASALLFFHFVGAASTSLAGEESLIWVGVCALAVAVISAGLLSAGNQLDQEKPAFASFAVSFWVIFPGLLAAWAFCVAIVAPTDSLQPGTLHITADVFWLWWMLAGAIGYGAAWSVGYGVTKLGKGRREKKPREEKHCKEKTKVPPSKEGGVSKEIQGAWYIQLFAAVCSGALLGLLMFAAVWGLSKIQQIDMWYAVAFGPPLFLLGLSFVVTVHIGSARRAFTEQDREWFARLGGFALWLCAAWILIFALILYATPFVQWLAGGGLVAFGTWLAGSGFGAWLAHGPSTDGKTGDKTGGIPWKEIAAQIAPWLFLAGLGVIVAYATHMALLKWVIGDRYVEDIFTRSCDTNFCIAATHTLEQLNKLPWVGTLCALGVTALVFFLMVWRLDINLFSLHAMYCNRITRAFLGASCPTKRKPNPFTGFDPDDDLRFHELDCQRPIPIINTSINMTGGDDLAWQTRHAASFAFTPVWAGFQTRSTQGAPLGTYRRTAEYAGGRPLGTLMAVSGAAASPNMGYHTKPGVAALMTAFNLRLGRWCGNPVWDKWDQESPRYATIPLFAELTGSATAQAKWINLTDGGHFDNLGVYELIRRRCRLIVVTDAGCDPKYQFEDLANTVRKCWTDLGVNIRFEHFEPMHRLKDSRNCGVHGAVGRIEYDRKGPHGAIIYLKSSMTGDEWPDIRQYADTHEDFPQETTADQFFDENQFEAYRHLGYKVVAKMVKKVADILKRDRDDIRNVPIADIVDHLVTFSKKETDATSGELA